MSISITKCWKLLWCSFQNESIREKLEQRCQKEKRNEVTSKNSNSLIPKKHVPLFYTIISFSETL